MSLHVAATYTIFYRYRSLCTFMVEWLACSLSKQKSGDSILGRCFSFFFFFFFFFFLFCLRNIYYHIRALNASPINATSNLFCLFALRLSIPVNNFMSCVAEPPYPGHKAILWEVNMSYKVTTWNVNRTQDLSFRSPMFYHLPIALSCKIQMSGLGRVRQYMCVYMFRQCYLYLRKPPTQNRIFFPKNLITF